MKFQFNTIPFISAEEIRQKVVVHKIPVNQDDEFGSRTNRSFQKKKIITAYVTTSDDGRDHWRMENNNRQENTVVTRFKRTRYSQLFDLVNGFQDFYRVP